MSELKNNQSVEARYWCDVASFNLLGAYILAKKCELIKRYDAEDYEDMLDDLDIELSRLGYGGATTESLNEALTSVKQSEPEFWTGQYLVLDEKGQQYQLSMGESGAEFDIDLETLNDSHFSKGCLVISHPEYTVTLTFSLKDISDDDEDFDIALISQQGEARCEGTLEIHGQQQSRKLKLIGKRNCFSQLGVERQDNGDPAQFWTGRYSLIDTKTWENITNAFKLFSG